MAREAVESSIQPARCWRRDRPRRTARFSMVETMVQPSAASPSHGGARPACGRALLDRACFGTSTCSTARSFHSARRGRLMDFRDAPEEAEFRARLRAWIARTPASPDDETSVSHPHQWHQALCPLVTPRDLPREFGGRDSRQTTAPSQRWLGAPTPRRPPSDTSPTPFVSSARRQKRTYCPTAS
jgi:hypothetical protein